MNQVGHIQNTEQSPRSRVRGHFRHNDFCKGFLKVLIKNKEWQENITGGSVKML
jgi:hypothetical protein